MKKRKYSFLNLLLWSLSALLVLMAGAGLLLGVWNVGSTGLLLTAAVLAATAVVRRWKKRREWMMTTIALLLVAGLAVHAAVWNYFAYGVRHRSKERQRWWCSAARSTATSPR